MSLKNSHAPSHRIASSSSTSTQKKQKLDDKFEDLKAGDDEDKSNLGDAGEEDGSVLLDSGSKISCWLIKKQ
jgi:hypothetical protein